MSGMESRDSGLGTRDARQGIADATSAPIERARAIIAERLASAARPCITSSFQAECVVLTHLLLEIRPDIPVLFLDTFITFARDATPTATRSASGGG